jgi:hypothetical protein
VCLLVLAATIPLSSCGGTERLLRIEARVDALSLGAQTGSLDLVASTKRLVHQADEPSARLEIDSHAEKVCRGLGQELRKTGRILGVVSGDDVWAPGALQQDDRLDHVSVDPAP